MCLKQNHTEIKNWYKNKENKHKKKVESGELSPFVYKF